MENCKYFFEKNKKIFGDYVTVRTSLRIYCADREKSGCSNGSDLAELLRDYPFCGRTLFRTILFHVKYGQTKKCFTKRGKWIKIVSWNKHGKCIEEQSRLEDVSERSA